MKLHVKSLVAAVCLIAPLAAFAAPSSTCSANGQSAFKALTQGHYDKVGAHFAPSVAGKLKPSVLKQFWQKLEAKAGSYQKLGSFQSRTVMGHKLEAAPMSFAKVKLAAVFACDDKDRLTTFAVLNPGKVPGLL